MKLVVLLLGVVFLAAITHGYPVGCEDEPELPPPIAEDQPTVNMEVVKVIIGMQKANVIDPPKLCPEGQMLDHQGKCRPVMG